MLEGAIEKGETKVHRQGELKGAMEKGEIDEDTKGKGALEGAMVKIEIEEHYKGEWKAEARGCNGKVGNER